MSNRIEISQDNWTNYLSEMTTSNRGRLIAVDIAAPNEVSHKPEIDIPAMGSPLFSLEYEPITKGNDIVLSIGEESLDYEHVIAMPLELTANLNTDGSLDSLEILAQGGARTRVNFLE
jgi:hypothetical protein